MSKMKIKVLLFFACLIGICAELFNKDYPMFTLYFIMAVAVLILIFRDIDSNDKDDEDD